MIVEAKKSKVVPAFEPIEIKITIESAQELCDQWLRNNLSGNAVDKENGCYLRHTSDELDQRPDFEAKLWKVLDAFVLERNLKNDRGVY